MSLSVATEGFVMNASKRRTEPAGITVTDLIVLVLGCAIALALPKIDRCIEHAIEGFEPPPPRAKAADWVVQFGTVLDVSLKCGLALALVAVGRCLRWGRVPRAVEWTAILLAFTLIDEIYLYLANDVFSLGWNWRWHWSQSRLPLHSYNAFYVDWKWLWSQGRLPQLIRVAFFESRALINLFLGSSICLACLASAILLRDRLPARIKAALMIGAAYAVYFGPATLGGEAAWALIDEYTSEETREKLPDWFSWCLDSLFELPTEVFFGVALLATIRTWRGPRSVRWMDYAILMAGVPYLLYFSPIWLLHGISGPIDRGEIASGILWYAGRLALVMALSWLVLRQLGPAWSRWLGVSYDGIRPSPTPPEA